MSTIHRPTRFDGLLPAQACVVESNLQMNVGYLFPEEQAAVSRAVGRRIEEFTMGRHCAREALKLAGHPGCPIPVGRNRAPKFPAGYSGTITHTANYCAAAVAPIGDILSIGIDAETDEAIGEDILSMICLPAERLMLHQLHEHTQKHWGKLLFSIKEAFYKAHFQLYCTFLEFSAALVAIEPLTQTFAIEPLHMREHFRTRSLSGVYSWRDGLVCTAVAIGRTDVV